MYQTCSRCGISYYGSYHNCGNVQQNTLPMQYTYPSYSSPTIWKFIEFDKDPGYYYVLNQLTGEVHRKKVQES